MKDEKMRGNELSAQVQQWLVDWFVARGKIGEDKIDQEKADGDYFAAGWLTSMEVVEFVMEIEQQFGMQFSDGDLQDSRFVTIAGLSELILERSTETSESR
jgi:acyl carrier protein